MPREHTAINSGFVQPAIAPMRATLVPQTAKKLFGGKDVAIPLLSAGVGTLEMYICTGCGFVEWHCQDPESIPIGSEYMTELVDHTPVTPFRG